MEKAIVNKIIPFSCVDGPGNRTAIFLQGCNFNCQYCHNPETIGNCINCGECVPFCEPKALQMVEGKVVYDIDKCVLCDACFKHCPHGASARTRSMDALQVLKEVEKNMPFIRGITVSGGECTLWRDFLVEFLGAAKKKGLNTLLDSNGSHLFSADPQLMAVCDGVMLDVKAWDRDEHIALTGQPNDGVKENLRWLAENHKLTEVRTVVVPELFDCEQTVREVCRLLRETGSLDTRYKIICFRTNGVREQYRHLNSPSVDTLQALRDLAADYGLRDVVII